MLPLLIQLQLYYVAVAVVVVRGKAWAGWAGAWRGAMRLSNARNPTQVNLFLYIFVCLCIYNSYIVYISL